MNPATIYHRPLSEFAFATDGTHYVFRLRTGKGEARSCRFFYADRAAMAPELDFACLPMKKIREDRYFDWYEVRLETKLERIAYYFELSDGAETLCYFGDCYEMAGTPTRADYFQLPFNHRADRNGRRTPLSTTFSRTASSTDSGRFPAAPMGKPVWAAPSGALRRIWTISPPWGSTAFI